VPCLIAYCLIHIYVARGNSWIHVFTAREKKKGMALGGGKGWSGVDQGSGRVPGIAQNAPEGTFQALHRKPIGHF